MAQLRVTLHGQEISRIDLDPSREYFAGRGSQCDILLSSARGVSRQHLRFFHDGQTWQVELVSRYGGLVFNGDPVDRLALTGRVSFGLPPFEFTFTDMVEEAKDDASEPMDQEPFEEQVEVPAEPVPETSGNLDSTVVAASTIFPHLHIRNMKSKTDETLKLEGHAWTLGRHPSCEIVVNDSAVSRKHFQIKKGPTGYTIQDFGSSNGTTINGDKIGEGETPLTSGDIITIRHLEITFEIRDSQFEKKAEVLPPAEDFLPMVADPGMNEYFPQPGMNYEGAAPVVRLPDAPPGGVLQALFQNKIRVIIVVLVVGLLIGLVSEDEQTAPPPGDRKDLTSNSPKPAELTEEQKSMARDMFKLAHSYFMQQKYEFCLSQFEKLHSMVPYYENSKEIENLCRQGIELQQINEDRERKLQEQKAVENRIRSIVAGCQQRMTNETTVEEVQTCLREVVELDPQNADMLQLIETVQIRENEKQDKLNKAKIFAQRKREGEAIYQKAMSLLKAGNIKAAEKEFRRFVTGRYPGLNQEEDEAQRAIASIEERQRQILNQKLSACRSAVDKGDFKNAIAACNETLSEDRGNREARELKDKAWKSLSREMKGPYQDAVLEESMGNIESAKQKWRKIKDTSVPGEDYYEKAVRKLKKYGG